MSEKDSQNPSCPQFNMYDTSCKTELKSNVVGKYYNSMEYTNHNFQHVSSEGKNDENLEKSLSKVPPIEIKLYKRRFLMLFLASFCSMMNAVPQFQFSVIADIVACYYGVSVNAADWTSIVYMVIFLPLVFPVMFLMDKKGLRYTVLGGGFLNCLGGWIQCAGLDPSRYIVIMVSQTIYAMGQVFLLSLPPFIAGVWFGAGEVGLACAFGVFGNQLGVAAGFIIPPLLIENNCTHQLNITHELTILSYPVAVINTVLFIALILVYQEKPKLFPSAAQAVKQSEAVEVNYIKSLKNLGKDVPYILLFIVYGLITGTYFSMSTILNQMVLIHFDDAEVDAGWMGAGMVFTGMAGSLLLGAVLDKTHRFKEISLLVCCSSFLLIVAYSLLIIMDTAMWVQFVFFGLLGFFLAGYLPVGLDFGAEITYPESEAMSASLLNASCQLFSIVITIISSALIEQYGDTASNIFFCACLLLATIITACIRCQLKRTNAGQCGTKE